MMEWDLEHCLFLPMNLKWLHYYSRNHRKLGITGVSGVLPFISVEAGFHLRFLNFHVPNIEDPTKKGLVDKSKYSTPTTLSKMYIISQLINTHKLPKKNGIIYAPWASDAYLIWRCPVNRY